MNINTKYLLGLVASLAICAGAQTASAEATFIALRTGYALPIHGGTTIQALCCNFGNNLTSLPFTQTTTYDFYSPPLSNAVPMTTSDKGGGVIYMQNLLGSTGTNGFVVTGRMVYTDYDPATGNEVLIVDTGASPQKNVNNVGGVNWAIPNMPLPANYTIPAGHMIHMAMTIALVSGGPTVSGQVFINGAQGSSSMALFPQNRASNLFWGFDSSAIYAPPVIVSIKPQPDGTMLISCSGSPATPYSLQASQNPHPASWETLDSTTSDSNGLFSFIDEEGAEYTCCFYRIAIP
jgi:hypothetical protein